LDEQEPSAAKPDKPVSVAARSRAAMRAAQSRTARPDAAIDDAAPADETLDETHDSPDDSPDDSPADIAGDTDAADAEDTADTKDTEDTQDTANTADTEDTEYTAIDDPVGDRARRRRYSPVLVAAVVVVVLAAAFVAASGFAWWQAAHSRDRAQAISRDQVLLAARLDVTALNTLDYRSVSAGLQKWLSVTTGSLHDQIQQAQSSSEKIIAEAKIITTGVVLAAAVTAIDDKTATVIASVNVKKQPVTGTAVTTRNRFSATMTRVDGVWKVSDLKTVGAALT
jgi:Mce-associated membrane protein